MTQVRSSSGHAVSANLLRTCQVLYFRAVALDSQQVRPPGQNGMDGSPDTLGWMEVRGNRASQDHRCAQHTPLCLYNLHVQQRPSSVKEAFAAKLPASWFVVCYQSSVAEMEAHCVINHSAPSSVSVGLVHVVVPDRWRSAQCRLDK